MLLFKTTLACLVLVILAATTSSKRIHPRSYELHIRTPSCASPDVPYGVTVQCHHNSVAAPCQGQDHPVKTTVAAYCRPFYKLERSDLITCLANATWSSPVPKCVPDCGKANEAVSLIVNGEAASLGMFPWQVALYHYMEDTWEFWCGGNLVSDHIVLTAAHCAWKVPPEKLIAALGKYHREFDVLDEGAQNIKVLRIEMLHSYQDVSGNYNGDLAALFLEHQVHLSATVRPVCIDWNQEHMDRQLQEGTRGVALGWGLTETDGFADTLRMVFLPVQNDDTCIRQQQRDFKKFVTYTTFCAGYNNGTGVCNGDSGGGLSFEDHSTGTYYLQGLVSVSPRRRGTAFCDPQYTTVFTKVSMFIIWLQKMMELQDELYDKVPAVLSAQSADTLDLNPKNNVLLHHLLDDAENTDDYDGFIDMNPELDVMLQRSGHSRAPGSSQRVASQG